MGWLSDVLGSVVSATATIIGVALKASGEIVDAASKAWQDYQAKRANERLPKEEVIRNNARDELKNVNDELLFINDKYHRRGSVTEQEQRRAADLRQRRDELKCVIDGIDEVSVAKDINSEPNAFEKLLLDNDRAHIFQGQVGVSAFGKKCPNCRRDMQIQWPRNVDTAKITDFFWGCSGWYFFQPNGQRLCSATMRISQEDLSIFARTDSPESQVSNNELTELTLLPGPREIVSERMNNIISEQRSQHRGAEDYRCPIHGEELVLRKKNQATALLDQYFLGCPRWKPNNQGCSYMVKLKSVMQLSTLLKKESGSGIL